MNDINKTIQDLYGAYVKKDLLLMKSLLDEGKSIDANNPYLRKYEALYEKLSSESSSSSTSQETSSQKQTSYEKIVQFGGKTIKCPHCGSNLSLSEKNKEVLERAKIYNTSNLNLSCTYCKTDFIWNTQGIKPLYLDISVGNEITLDNKKYRVSGAARYLGYWRTKNSGRLEYLERILIVDKGDTYYLSESKAWWNEGGESGIEYQTELSRKIVPDFNLGGLTDGQIIINDNNYSIEEVCEVKVTEVYGENSKSYTIGESVKTYQLRYNGKSYIFEEESTHHQKELGIYHTWEVNDADLRSGTLGVNSIPSFPFSGSSFTVLKWIAGIVTFFITFFIFSHESVIHEVTLNDLAGKSLSEVQGLYKVNFSDIYKKQISDSTTRYDYGGVKHTIRTLEGIKFKVETQQDLDILKDILNGKLDITSSQIPQYNLDFGAKSFSTYFTDNTIVQFK